ncbi:hypothetical protein IGB42_04168 [Andreprevotia sp. IGB-42]|uniref:hypothetical protein n=1 Tax=Andreprevotia sp. IGB-42 TaxID=2497473 RepID=UPI001358C17A|nr:hypothetical protein [Andreprevotia sp. IGB-42]KAF0811331.1 hypothetical protein IGB42_04168 [Andreprevotia sp. IGB-42]
MSQIQPQKQASPPQQPSSTQSRQAETREQAKGQNIVTRPEPKVENPPEQQSDG